MQPWRFFLVFISIIAALICGCRDRTFKGEVFATTPTGVVRLPLVEIHVLREPELSRFASTIQRSFDEELLLLSNKVVSAQQKKIKLHAALNTVFDDPAERERLERQLTALEASIAKGEALSLTSNALEELGIRIRVARKSVEERKADIQRAITEAEIEILDAELSQKMLARQFFSKVTSPPGDKILSDSSGSFEVRAPRGAFGLFAKTTEEFEGRVWLIRVRETDAKILLSDQNHVLSAGEESLIRVSAKRE